jgi:hypothetical protein
MIYFMKISKNDFSSYTAATLTEDSRQWSTYVAVHGNTPCVFSCVFPEHAQIGLFSIIESAIAVQCIP